MSVFRSLAMLMKNNDLKLSSRDVDENKGSYKSLAGSDRAWSRIQEIEIQEFRAKS